MLVFYLPIVLASPRLAYCWLKLAIVQNLAVPVSLWEKNMQIKSNLLHIEWLLKRKLCAYK